MKRIYHHWETWECVQAGMYSSLSDIDHEDTLERYAEFLRDIPRFRAALERVLSEWPISCEQFLSNDSINRIAWLGQASMCIDTGIPRLFRGGFKLLSDSEQRSANAAAQDALTTWYRYKRRSSNSSTSGNDADIHREYQMRFPIN
jgi:hypothetical protein